MDVRLQRAAYVEEACSQRPVIQEDDVCVEQELVAEVAGHAGTLLPLVIRHGLDTESPRAEPCSSRVRVGSVRAAP